MQVERRLVGYGGYCRVAGQGDEDVVGVAGAGQVQDDRAVHDRRVDVVEAHPDLPEQRGARGGQLGEEQVDIDHRRYRAAVGNVDRQQQGAFVLTVCVAGRGSSESAQGRWPAAVEPPGKRQGKATVLRLGHAGQVMRKPGEVDRVDNRGEHEGEVESGTAQAGGVNHRVEAGCAALAAADDPVLDGHRYDRPGDLPVVEACERRVAGAAHHQAM